MQILYLHNPTEATQGFANVIPRVIAHLNKFADQAKINEAGWRCILEYVELDGNIEDALLHLDIQSQFGEGKNCTEAKLQTMRNHPTYPATGWIPEELLGENDKKWRGGIAVPWSGTLINPRRFDPKDGGNCIDESGEPKIKLGPQEFCARDTNNQCPNYPCNQRRPEPFVNINGILRVAFSGSDETVDLTAALMVAHAFEHYLKVEFKNESIVFDYTVFDDTEAARLINTIRAIAC